MGFSLGHLIILLIIVLLFGGKRLPELGGAMGKGLRSFKRGLEGKLDEEDGPPPQLTNSSKEGAASESAQVSAAAKEKDPVQPK